MNGAAGLLIVGLRGPRLAPEDKRALRRLRPAGVILFGRNLESAAQLHALVAELCSAVPGLLLFLDAEGGRVDRLRQLVAPAPAAARLAAAPPALAERAGRWVGRALRHFGFDADFAPVVDLDRGQVSNALDGRTLGRTPRAVVPRARAFLRGLHAAGVGGCLKHFPGLGGATRDTHFEGAPIVLPADRLVDDLAPFVALDRLARALMIGHAAYAAYDASGRPASLSRPIASALRRRLGLRGVAFSDDLDMRALAAWGDHPQVARQALAAGCDVLAICGPESLDIAPQVAAALGAPGLRPRRAEAAARLERYRRHLAALRRRAPVETLERVRGALDRLAAHLEESADRS